MLKARPHIPRIVITGGPSGGKTSALSMLLQKLPSLGYAPFTVPEVATLILSGGVRIGDIVNDQALYAMFQEQILRAQLDFERRWKKFAQIQPGEKKIIICDRGSMDGKAYIEPGIFSAIFRKLGTTESDLRDKRYDAVFHMVTAAFGAE